MRGHFEFATHALTAEAALAGDIDPVLALMGSQGWEIRGVTATRDGTVIVALQRPLDEETALPDAPALSTALARPLAAPSLEELEREMRRPGEEEVA